MLQTCFLYSCPTGFLHWVQGLHVVSAVALHGATWKLPYPVELAEHFVQGLHTLSAVLEQVDERYVPAGHCTEEQAWHAHAVTLRKYPEEGQIFEEQLAHWDVSDQAVPSQLRFRNVPEGQVASDEKLHALHCRLSQIVQAASLYWPAAHRVVHGVHSSGWLCPQSEDRKKSPGVHELGHGLQNCVSEVVLPVHGTVWSSVFLGGHVLVHALQPSSKPNP